jgi:hypothetical protein
VTFTKFDADPTTKLPTEVEEAVAGNVRSASNEVEKGSKVKLPAVFTLNAAEFESPWTPLATIRIFPPVDEEAGE